MSLYFTSTASAVKSLSGSAMALRNKNGALVTAAEKGSAADAAGLQPGEIIFSVNGGAIGRSRARVACTDVHRPGRYLVQAASRSDRGMIRPYCSRG